MKTGCLDQKTIHNNFLSARNMPHWQRHAQTKSKRMKNYLPGKQKLEESRSRYTLTWKTDFKPKSIRRHRDDHYILVYVTTHEEDVTIVNIYVPKIETPKQFLRQDFTVAQPGLEFTIVTHTTFKLMNSPVSTSWVYCHAQYLVQNTQFYKTNATEYKGTNRFKYNNSGDFNTLFSSIDRSSI
jgi:hypothetical protein